jgi:DNA adenine methylase
LLNTLERAAIFSFSTALEKILRFNTPLRYPGGKGKLTDFIKLVFKYNELLDGDYVEPYAGGAGIALNLLMHNYVTCIHLNDLNKAVYTFWSVLLSEPDNLCRLINDTEITVEQWSRQKSIFKDPKNHTLLEIAYATFFLNRTNRSGIILGGVIGGKNQNGNWKLDARFNKPDLINRINSIALFGTRIRLYNLDASELIKLVLPKLPTKTLVYFDPPYYVQGQGLYENHYKHDDHVAIAKLVQSKVKLPWIVSYDHAPEIVEMYKNSRSITYGINYSAQNKYEGSEAMFFSKNLVIPEVRNPANLKAA